MDYRHSVIGVLLLALMTSGCIGGGGDGGGLNIGPGGKTITVTNFEIQPNEILEGEDTQINVGVVNTGVMQTNISVGKNGERILTNYCTDMFSIGDFNAYSTRSEDTIENYSLSPGGELQLSWSLNHKGDVFLSGEKCPLSLQIPFDYGVSAYQQLEVKRDREVQGSTSLRSRTSKGPMNINMEITGSANSPSFLKGDNMEILMEMENTAPEDSSYQGLVDIDRPVIKTSERFLINSTTCNLETVGGKGRMTQKVKIKNEMSLSLGQSRIVRCDVRLTKQGSNDPIDETYNMNVPSVRGQITSSVNYTYIKDLGTTDIKVKSRG